MSFPHNFWGIFMRFGLLISLGLEKSILNTMIYVIKGHFCSWKGADVLVEKSYQKKKKKWNKNIGKCSGAMRLSDLELNPSATLPPTPQPTLPEKNGSFFS